MRIGITGHQRLQNPASWEWVRQEMAHHLGEMAVPLIGISSLAVGADQLFANVILQLGGELEAISPFDGYESTFVVDRDLQEFMRLLECCTRSETLERLGSDEEAYFAAGKRVVDLADVIVGVWDGLPARGLGGTADAVEYGLEQRKRLVHLNPITRTRHYIVQVS